MTVVKYTNMSALSSESSLKVSNLSKFSLTKGELLTTSAIHPLSGRDIFIADRVDFLNNKCYGIKGDDKYIFIDDDLEINNYFNYIISFDNSAFNTENTDDLVKISANNKDYIFTGLAINSGKNIELSAINLSGYFSANNISSNNISSINLSSNNLYLNNNIIVNNLSSINISSTNLSSDNISSNNITSISSNCSSLYTTSAYNLSSYFNHIEISGDKNNHIIKNLTTSSNNYNSISADELSADNLNYNQFKTISISSLSSYTNSIDLADSLYKLSNDLAKTTGVCYITLTGSGGYGYGYIRNDFKNYDYLNGDYLTYNLSANYSKDFINAGCVDNFILINVNDNSTEFNFNISADHLKPNLTYNFIPICINNPNRDYSATISSKPLASYTNNSWSSNKITIKKGLNNKIYIK